MNQFSVTSYRQTNDMLSILPDLVADDKRMQIYYSNPNKNCLDDMVLGRYLPEIAGQGNNRGHSE